MTAAAVTLPWWLLAAAGVAVVLVTAGVTAAVTGALARRSEDRTAAPPARPVPATAPPQTPAAVRSPEPSRPDVALPGGTPDSLRSGLIEAHDLATSNPGVRSHIESVLGRVGVARTPVQPGDTFDPDAHLAVGTAPGDEAQVGMVAEVVRPGWSDGGTQVRPAEVVVWTR